MKTKKKSFKNKILVAAVCFGAIGTTGVQLANVASANALETRVWVGDVPDERWQTIDHGRVLLDQTTYKTLRCSHGYYELPPSQFSQYFPNSEAHHWIYRYQTY